MRQPLEILVKVPVDLDKIERGDSALHIEERLSRRLAAEAEEFLREASMSDEGVEILLTEWTDPT